MEKTFKTVPLFNFISKLFIVGSIILLISALFRYGFGGIFPLWGRLLGIFVLLWVIFKNRARNIVLQINQGKMNQKEILRFSSGLILFITAIVIVVTLWHHNSQQRYLQNVFANFFPKSFITKVNIVNGRYFAWLDWNADLVFSTDQETFDSMVKDYEIIAGKNIGSYFSHIVMISPDTVFYYKDVPKGDRQCEEYLVAWDKKNNTAYFHGSGYKSYVQILSAKSDIPKGTVVSEDMVGMKSVTFTKLGKLAILSNASEPVGKVAVRDISKGEQIDCMMLK